MVHILIQWLISSVVLMIVAYVVPGFHIQSFGSAMIASLVIGFLNALVRPILFFLTIPITILTLGLFTFVLNAIILRLAAGMLKGFEIDGWLSAIVGAIVLAIVNYVFFSLLGPSPAEVALLF